MQAVGSKLGPYEILAPIGAGAMGEVYRARDARLQRDVAVKVLPPTFASDADRLRRFEQEARAAGQLNHPNILAVFDAGTHEGTPYVVTELLEGETLRDRLSSGPLPLRRAIEFGVQIAHGLAAAHEHGIVHRDLKPENLFVTHDGHIKILDFGLAKLMRPDGAALREYDSLAGTMTQTGMILGTAGYMSPEQVRGQPADHRSDLFAFGAILYEMVAARRAFHGESAVETLHAILREEPAAPSGSRADAPPALERIIAHCLEKRPEERFQSARDVAFALESLAEGAPAAASAATHGTRPRALNREGMASLIAALALAAAAIATVRLFEGPAPGLLVQFSIASPENTTIHGNGGDQAISPDGRLVAFVANDSAGTPHLWVRPLDSAGARMLGGTENSDLPFWSPDSRSIGFFIEGKLKRVPAAGGQSEVICDLVSGRGGTWSRDGVILFAPTPSGPLYRVPASGGEPTQVTTLDSTRHETAHRFPLFLPDGRHFLFVSLPAHQGSFDVLAGALASKKTERVGASEARPVYDRRGYLVFTRHQALVAQVFDPARLRLSGNPQTIGNAPGLTQYDSEPAASVSDGGILTFPNSALPNTTLEWFDRAGRSLSTVPIPEGRYENLALSPDGRRVVVERRMSAQEVDLWIADPARGVASRLTFDPLQNTSPVWTPDGARVIYASNRLGPAEFYQKLSSGAGDDVPVYQSSALFKSAVGVTPDGKALVFEQLDRKTAWDIWSVPLSGGGPAAPYLHSPFNEIPSALSPDGHWLAYNCDESGRSEVYVQSFPTPGEKYQVSTSGSNSRFFGVAPSWTQHGKELLYGSPDGVTIMSAEVSTIGGFQTSTPKVLFRMPDGIVGISLAPDGQRILATVPAAGGKAASLTILLNWSAALKR